MLAFLRAMVGPDDAEDCFQETFIAALRAYDRMDGRHPRAWVMTIARRKAIDHHRARARRPEPREHAARDRGAADATGGLGDLDGEVWTAVAGLCETQADRGGPALRGRPRLPRDRRCAGVQRGGGAAPGGRRPAGPAPEDRSRGDDAMSIDARRIGAVLGEGTDELAADAAARLIARAEAEGLVDVAYASYDSPLGTGHIAATSRGLVSVGLPNLEADAFLAQLTRASRRGCSSCRARLDERPPRARRVLRGPPARLRPRRSTGAWCGRGSRAGSCTRPRRSRSAPPSTYGEVAARAGNPRAYRAAGTALGHNPIPIVVPCHRVLRVRRRPRPLRRRTGDEGVPAPPRGRDLRLDNLTNHWQPM